MADRTRRSSALVTDDDLERLRTLVLARHDELATKRPDWCSALLAACLVQGAARHRVYEDRGVKDLDAYLFYVTPPDRHPKHFPFNRGTVQRDFGPSPHGRQLYTEEDRAELGPRLSSWERFAGRRVDLMARAIADAGSPRRSVTAWLESGGPGSSAWHLAQAPVVSLHPELGEVWWDPGPFDAPRKVKGFYR